MQLHYLYVAALSGQPACIGKGNITRKWHQPIHQGLKGLYHTKAQSKSVHITRVRDRFHFGVKFAALPHLWDTRILIATH